MNFVQYFVSLSCLKINCKEKFTHVKLSNQITGLIELKIERYQDVTKLYVLRVKVTYYIFLITDPMTRKKT